MTYPRARKRLGQHFLADPRILARIADALDITPRDTVVEIGPGRGALTDVLAARAARVVAIEVDRDLVAMLRLKYAANPRVTIVEQDVLDANFGTLAGIPYLLAGNIPYNITTPILFHALKPPRPARAVYLVQREVAERVAARPGSAEYGALSANLQALARPELLFRVAAGSFMPAPSVESAVLRVTPLEAPIVTPDEEATFRATVVGAFGFRRKQMGRVVRELWALGAGDAAALLHRAGIAATSRPEVLAPADFARLIRAR